MQPVDEAIVIRNDAPADGRLAQALAAVERRAQLEEGTRNVVVEWVDKETGDVINQFPAELTLKMRAYWRDKERAETATESQSGILI